MAGVAEPKRTATGQVPAVGAEPRRTATGQMAAVGATPPPAPAPGASAPRELTAHQKQQLGSGFVDAEAERRRKAMLGVPAARAPEAAQVTKAPLARFDGQTAPPELTSRDLWKALAPPVTSAPGQRDPERYLQVIHQFAVGTNPRYEPEGPGKPRGHIFVWDISRAMGCEVPHFVGARELTVAQTVDWLRHEGPMRGWHKVADHDVLEVCKLGTLIVALPRDIKVKQLAIVAPQEMPNDFKPRLTGACLKRGAGLTLLEAFGLRQGDYFTHE
jgi:hypothetical protein